MSTYKIMKDIEQQQHMQQQEALSVSIVSVTQGEDD